MRIGITAGRDQFSKLVRLAQKGKPVIITRHGKAVARIRGFQTNIEPDDLARRCIASTDRLIANILKSSTTARRKKQ